MFMEKILTHEFFISANESNPEGELAVNILISNIIEIATAHANALGIGNPAMAHLNAGWVLSRLTLEMEEYPKVNTSYRLSTWVEDWNRHFSVRDFEVQDQDGRTVGYARSIWMVLDMSSHDNFGLSHLSMPMDIISDKECPIGKQARHRDIVSAVTPDEAVTPTELRANVPDTLYTFRYNDIDFYRHVNTVRYVTLLLNSYTLEDFDRNRLARLELSFLHEGAFGETVAIRRHDHRDETGESRKSSFSLFAIARNIPILFARIILTPRQ